MTENRKIIHPQKASWLAKPRYPPKASCFSGIHWSQERGKSILPDILLYYLYGKMLFGGEVSPRRSKGTYYTSRRRETPRNQRKEKVHEFSGQQQHSYPQYSDQLSRSNHRHRNYSFATQ